MLTGVLMRVVIVRRLLAYAVGAVYAIPVLFYILVSLIKTRGKILRSKPRDKKPECLEDPAYGEHKLASLQDVTLHYVESGQAGNPLMIMVHGFPECWYSWRHQIREFQQQYKVIAIDQRGYYPSSSPSGAHNYTVDKLVQDVKQLIIYLGYERCTLVGHDWGGETCWGVAAKYPELVERLIILNAPHPNTFLPHLTSTLSQFRKSWYMFLFQLPYLPEILYRLGDMGMLDRVFLGRRGGVRSGKMTKADVEAYKYLFANGSFTGPLNYIRALTRVRDVITGPSQVTCPTLMLWGDCDQFLDSGFIKLTKPYVSNLQIHLIEDASHWVQMDQPEIVNLHIREFLKST